MVLSQVETVFKGLKPIPGRVGYIFDFGRLTVYECNDQTVFPFFPPIKTRNQNMAPIGHKKLKWSNVKDVLWSLREYMVLEGHSFQTSFLIKDAQGTVTLGFGCLLHSKPSIDSTKAIKGRRISRTLSCVQADYYCLIFKRTLCHMLL